jgi:hypothetical protein
MIHKAITLKFAVPAALILALESRSAPSICQTNTSSPSITSSPAATELLSYHTLTGDFRTFTCCLREWSDRCNFESMMVCFNLRGMGR